MKETLHRWARKATTGSQLFRKGPLSAGVSFSYSYRAEGLLDWRPRLPCSGYRVQATVFRLPCFGVPGTCLCMTNQSLDHCDYRKETVPLMARLSISKEGNLAAE